MAYTGTHKRNIRKSTNISTADLRNGMLVEIQYKSLSKKTIEDSVYIVLNAKFEQHVHVLDLDKVPEQTLYDLFRHTSNKRPAEFSIRNQTFTKYSFSKTSNALYDSAIKPLVTSKIPGSYKTLLRTRKDGAGIQQIKVIDYKWDSKRLPPLPKTVDKVIADTNESKP